MRRLGLYIHIPFCVKKCNYCDFYSLSCPKNDNLSDYVSIICTHIEREAELYKDCIIDSIFIGGGTPSLIESKDFERLSRAICSNFTLAQGLEFSIEANPGTLTKEKLNIYKKCGVNRLSLGLQSASDRELSCLGRIHTLDEFKESFSLARGAGFDNINIDIMYSLPNQRIEDFISTLNYVTALEPEHISSYCLKIEDGTPFSKMELSLPSEDTQYDMYLTMCERLKGTGYEQYEISNFSKKGFRCVHNLKYWLQMEYIGFGPSAHSFFDGARCFYESNLNDYKEAILKNSLPKKHKDSASPLSEEELIDEYIMLRMRLCDGVDSDELLARFGIDFSKTYDIQKYIDTGYIIKKNNSYFFSSKGFFVSNYILSDILENI